MGDRFSELDISSFDLLPPLYRDTDTTNNARDLCLALDDELALQDALLERFSRLPQADRCTYEWLPHLAYKFGIRHLPTMADVSAQRKLIGNAAAMWARKGSYDIIKDVIFLLTGMTCEVTGYWNHPLTLTADCPRGSGRAMAGPGYRRPIYGAFISGVSRSGTARISSGPQNQNLVYTFRIWLHRQPDAREALLVAWTAKLLKKSQDHYRVLWPATSTVWIIGVSRIGIDARVGPGSWRSGMSRALIGTMARRAIPATPATWYIVP